MNPTRKERGANKETGFTLIEVLAALVIFSVAIIGLIQAGAQSTRTVTALESKLLAGIVADNQIILTRSRPVTLGIRTGTATQMSQTFTYRIETRTTDAPNFFRITVIVRRADAEQRDQPRRWARAVVCRVPVQRPRPRRRHRRATDRRFATAGDAGSDHAADGHGEHGSAGTDRRAAAGTAAGAVQRAATVRAAPEPSESTAV